MRSDPFERSNHVVFWLAAILLVASQTLCNGPDGIAGVVIAQTGLLLVAIATILGRFAFVQGGGFHGNDRLIVALLIGIALLAIIQLTPLPPALWASLAGREDPRAEMQGIGAAVGWRPLSFSPLATERSLLALLPALAMFLAARALSSIERKRLLWIALAFGSIAAVLGIAQVAGGPDSDLRLYRPTNAHDAVGFFANRNHFGSLLAMLLPFAIGWVIHEIRSGGEVRFVRLIRILLPYLVVFLLLIGILLSHSRAGLLLIALAGLGALVQLWRSGAGWRIVLAVGACGAVAGLLAVLIAGNDVLSRLTALDLGADTRWPVQATTIAAAHRYGVFGSGLGSFVNAYQSVAPEYQPDQNAFVNHANNDYLELWLEAGWPGALLVALFGIWYVRAAFVAWGRPRSSSNGTMIARAASIALALALVHAALEYQLRKPGISVLFGLCCALLSAQVAESSARLSRSGTDGRKRRRSSGERPAVGAVRG